MFTGLIEEIGVISGITRFGAGLKFKISCSKILDDVKVDDSISINGACQTVINFGSNFFEVDTIEETIRKSTLGKFKIGDKVNLERALKLSSRLGGHIVQGHVDTIGKITSIKQETVGKNYQISFPEDYQVYLVNSGSITINGVSLTNSSVSNSSFTVSIIPHTIENTTIKLLQIGDDVNLEFDILGKYIQNLLDINQKKSQKQSFWDNIMSES